MRELDRAELRPAIAEIARNEHALAVIRIGRAVALAAADVERWIWTGRRVECEGTDRQRRLEIEYRRECRRRVRAHPYSAVAGTHEHPPDHGGVGDQGGNASRHAGECGSRRHSSKIGFFIE